MSTRSMCIVVFSTLLVLVSSFPSVPSADNESVPSSTLPATSTPFQLLTESDIVTGMSSNSNETNFNTSAEFDISDGTQCVDGIILSVWHPQYGLTLSDRIGRGLVYFIALCYLFVGVAIVSDRFMASIEVITSNEKQVKVRKPNGEVQVVNVRVWNETVANLTLMALGSSSPEILLSIIEIIGKNFKAGELGPGTIVGSAAYNLFIIIAVCVSVIPNGETRKIKHLRVFFVTATWSLFAYIWMYLILSYFSPGQVEVWEAFLTFIFFPVCVLTAYIAERRLLVYKYLSKEYRMNKRGILVKSETAEQPTMNGYDKVETSDNSTELYYTDKNFKDARQEYLSMLQTVRKEFPHSNLEHWEIVTQERLMSSGPKSRAFYRVQATRKFTGSGDIFRRIADQAENDLTEVKAELQKLIVDDTCYVFFEPGHYAIMENCESFQIRVVRRGNLSDTTTVTYETEDGSAEAGADYVKTQGTLVFSPGVTEQRFTLSVLDDEMYEEDKHFYVRLSNVSEPAVLSTPKVATVMIIDDDHGGSFGFTSKENEIVESVGVYDIKVQRNFGARGKVILPYWTENGTAAAGKDYEPLQGQLEFDDNESEKVIQLVVRDENRYEKDVTLFVQLGEPRTIADAIEYAEAKSPEDLTETDKLVLLGRPTLGEHDKVCIRIKESKEFKSTVDKLVQRVNHNILIGKSSYKQQFIDALSVRSGDDSSDDDGGPSRMDYIMHYITVFWKLIFAFIPPTDMVGGYVCFVVSIIGIGYMTAIIGDVASHFGCTVGIKDSVTAIIFVAAGTSLPDTFASKISAINDKTADNSIGNVTGSNAVNVFLGIGVAWTLAAIYHAYHGEVFVVNPGTLAFTLSLFLAGAIIAIGILLARRSKKVGGELGGPAGLKYATSAVLFGIWLMYVTTSTLEAYGIVEGF
ncbi:sodium/calcium exchanger 1-like [Bradysia coprophila]|uniref:sodium/calcium exchanger 1-like n=1 Tax=Bradysia coprophila TaxID=38358 RepID=UPI00187DAD67|nr:sodium/calcium exchanger 1-like [Bradysia coprophila]XP_037045002.1 sodium/calcium exchanger 1-like [Bradysia coprophila]